MNIKRNQTANILASEYIHIDNGGTTFSLVEYCVDGRGPHLPGVENSDSYYGYSESKIAFYEICQKPDNLRKIAAFL